MDNDERVPSPAVDKRGKSSPLLTLVTPECFGTTLASLRHDIRTALHQMIGYSEMLIEDAEQEEPLEMLAGLREANAEVRSTQALTTVFFSLAEEIQEIRLPSLRDQLHEAGEKMVARAQKLEKLATSEKADRLLPDLRKLETAARSLLGLGDPSGAPGTRPVDRSQLVAIAASPASSNVFPADPARPVSAATGARKRPSFLVVDDSEGNRDLLSRWLKREGYSVLLAANGRQALEMVRQQEPDVILLDLRMPELDGIAVLRELKADPQLRQLPVIVISAGNDIRDVVRCIEMGAEDYLSKPFDLVLLRARVGALLERQRLRDEERRKSEELESAFLEIKRQRQLAEDLLLNILPAKVAEELRAKGFVDPMYFEDVTIVFADFVGFTLSTEKLPADRLVRVLHEYFTAFDRILANYELEKLKTIGDCYMFVGGLPVRSSSHPVEAVLATLEMVHVVQEMASPQGLVNWQLRVGMHTGPVVAGVVGIRKFAFDIWGEAVNLSARMESSGAPDRVNLSATTYDRVRDFFVCEPRGKVRTKDGREVDMYFANGVAPSLLGDGSLSVPSAFERRYRTYFQKELKSFPEFLLKQKAGRPLLAADTRKADSAKILHFGTGKYPDKL